MGLMSCDQAQLLPIILMMMVLVTMKSPTIAAARVSGAFPSQAQSPPSISLANEEFTSNALMGLYIHSNI